MKRIMIMLLVSAILLGTAIVPAGASGIGYTDVSDDAWYAESVEYVTSKGLMNGVSSGCFAPDDITSRAIAVTVLWRRDGSIPPDPAPDEYMSFYDVWPSDWYNDAIEWAYRAEIADGYRIYRGDDTPDFAPLYACFLPDQSVTREELATFLYRYATYLSMDTTAATDLNEFSDGETVSDWAKDAVQWCVASGLLCGMAEDGSTVLDPKGFATRAQLATILMRFDTLFE